LRLTPPAEAFPWDDIRKIFAWMLTDAKGTKWRKKLPKFTTA